MNTYISSRKRARVAGFSLSKGIKAETLALFLTVIFLTVTLLLPNVVRSSVKASLTTCVTRLIPSLFPFMIASEIFFTLGGQRVLGKIFGKPFNRAFGINGAGVGAFLLGAVCGLPLGGKYALSLYKNGDIGKEECELLMGISNNVGLGFVVMGIGYSLWNSTAFGWLLYLTQLFAATGTGIILSKKNIHRQKTNPIAPTIRENEKKTLPAVLTDAITASTVNMLKLCGFVVFFGVISAFIAHASQFLELPPLFHVTLSSFTEITFATEQARSFYLGGSYAALHSAKILTFFAVGFSGMSAHLQLASFAAHSDVKMKTYYLAKLLCGLICALTGAIVLHYTGF